MIHVTPRGPGFFSAEGQPVSRWCPDGFGNGTHVSESHEEDNISSPHRKPNFSLAKEMLWRSLLPKPMNRSYSVNATETMESIPGNEEAPQKESHNALSDTDPKCKVSRYRRYSSMANFSHGNNEFQFLCHEVMYAAALRKEQDLHEQLRRHLHLEDDTKSSAAGASPSKEAARQTRGENIWSRRVPEGAKRNQDRIISCRKQLRNVVWMKLHALTSSTYYQYPKGEGKDNIMFLHTHQWIEATDPKHRYGSNLMHYFMAWLRSSTDRSFFSWLDFGEGREMDLSQCPRAALETTRVKYCCHFERRHFRVVVHRGRLLYHESGELVHQPDEMKEKLIFVMSPSHELYIAAKERGRFHHSSFLAGGPTIAAGAMKVKQGCIKTIIPHSGHYRPSEEDIQHFIYLLKEMGLEMDNVKIVPFKNYSKKDIARTQIINDMIAASIARGSSRRKSIEIPNDNDDQVTDTDNVSSRSEVSSTAEVSSRVEISASPVCIGLNETAPSKLSKVTCATNKNCSKSSSNSSMCSTSTGMSNWMEQQVTAIG